MQRHAQAGRLDPFELDERLEAALSAKTFRELQRLTADLPDETRTPQALRRRKVGELREHLGFWLTVSTICVAVWAATGADYFWPLWPIGFIGLHSGAARARAAQRCAWSFHGGAPSRRSARPR